MNKLHRTLVGIGGMTFVFALIMFSLGKLPSNALIWMPLAFTLMLFFKTGKAKKDRIFEKFWLMIGIVWVLVFIYDIVKSLN